MSVPDDVWRSPQGTRPETPYGGFYPNVPSGYLPAAVPVSGEPTLDLRGEAATGLIVLTLCVFLGAPLGLVWAALRPHFNVLVVSAGEESALKPQFGADMKLAGLGLAAGAIAGFLAWAFLRRNGTGAAVGLAIGGFLAMEVAAHVGKLSAHPEHLRAVVQSQLPANEMLTGTKAEINSFLDLMSFQLRSPGVLFTFSVGALLFFGVMNLIKDRSAPSPYRLSFTSSSGIAAAGSVPAPVQP